MPEYIDAAQELAHEMVVEMLARQFVYPVKWYATLLQMFAMILMDASG